MTFQAKLLSFLRMFRLMLTIFVALAVAFGVYVHSEKQIDRAHELRHSTFRLADELRRSSDDLTRMARTYVATGDPRYLQRYRDILDIREGRTPRPAGHEFDSWALAAAGTAAPRVADGPAVALLERMREAGFADEEFRKLAQAKANSDALTAIEFSAMAMVADGGQAASAGRAQALRMLHDDRYHAAKAAIMAPINEVYVLADRRTAEAVRSAERAAVAFRVMFILGGMLATFMLWRTLARLRRILGGTPSEVRSHMARIGQGDLSAAIEVPGEERNSVMAALAAMQARLKSIENERETTERAVRQSERMFSTAFSSCPVAASIATADDGRFVVANANYERDFGWTRDDLIGRSSVEVGIWPDRETREAWLAAMRAGGGRLVNYETVWRAKSGERRDVSLSSEATVLDGRPCILAYATDITTRKQVEQALLDSEMRLRVAAAAFESQEGIVVTDARGVILRVNQAFVESTGYAAEEAVGKTPRILKSGRHDQAFYAAMWESLARTGAWQGEIWDRRKDGGVYLKWLTISAVRSVDGVVTNYVGTHHDITERKKAEEKIRELAFFDPLTHLPNRTLLMDRLRQAMTAGNRSGAFGAVLFIDLDHFKTLNDTLGHDMGDGLLREAARRLAACVREEDTVARLGGDEFVVVLGGLDRNPKEAAARTELVGGKILAALARDYRLGAVDHRSSASIGATLFRGHETAIEDLLRQADLAMYKSKDSGRNALHFFDPAMQVAVVERAALESGLRSAIDRGQLVLHYQAQVDEGRRVIGAEVLVRWQHPERGLVPPVEFIPLAEETGLILPLGAWALDTVCRQLAQWAADPRLAELTVAVNVSARQLRQADFVAAVTAGLDATGADPGRLKLELTESLLVNNIEDTIGKMSALKAHGVGFSLDDFGTGYSSLSYLKRLPLDQLKIDQSFVRDILVDPNDAVIARTVVALAQSLGLGVIAEGVETEEQRAFLARSGCHAYQGYLFSRPLPLAEFEALVRRG